MLFLRILLAAAVICCTTGYAQEPQPAKVVVSNITTQQVAQRHTFIGTFFYDRTSHVSSEVGGLVTRITVKEGDRVSKGTPLAYLDTQILDKEIRIQENLIEQAQLTIDHTRTNFKRAVSLHQKNATSKQNYDDAEFFYQEAVLKKTAAEILLQKLQIQKKKSVIRAPFDGVVLEKNVDSGDWVQQGKILVSLGSVNDLAVKVPVAETLLRHISVGGQVETVINAYSRKITGVIDHLEAAADERTKNVFLNIRIPVQPDVVRNMSATVYIFAGNERELSIIPRDALVKFRGGNFVYAVKDKKAVMMPVNIVTYLGDRIGADNKHFYAGMPVVVDGNERLRADQPVIIVNGY